eukprot:g29323.t1
MVEITQSAARNAVSCCPQNLMTMCVVDFFQALTQLGLMGINIDAAVHAECKHFETGPVTWQAVPKPLRKRLVNARRARCATTISTILANIGQRAMAATTRISVLYFSFTSFHCTNKANIRAICGAGIAGIEASLAGAAGSGAALYAACKEGKMLVLECIPLSQEAFVFAKRCPGG